MKKLIVLRLVTVLSLLVGAVSSYGQEPDPRLAGVWKRHIIGAGNFVWDQFIRVDIDGSQVFVSIKKIGSDDDGKPFQYYDDAKDITINSDGSVSFSVYYCQREYDDEDHLYWTQWDRYTIKNEGKRLNVTVKWEAYGANSQGRILRDRRSLTSPQHFTYFNINDNW